MDRSWKVPRFRVENMWFRPEETKRIPSLYSCALRTRSPTPFRHMLLHAFDSPSERRVGDDNHRNATY